MWSDATYDRTCEITPHHLCDVTHTQPLKWHMTLTPHLWCDQMWHIVRVISLHITCVTCMNVLRSNVSKHMWSHATITSHSYVSKRVWVSCDHMCRYIYVWHHSTAHVWQIKLICVETCMSVMRSYVSKFTHTTWSYVTFVTWSYVWQHSTSHMWRVWMRFKQMCQNTHGCDVIISVETPHKRHVTRVMRSNVTYDRTCDTTPHHMCDIHICSHWDDSFFFFFKKHVTWRHIIHVTWLQRMCGVTYRWGFFEWHDSIVCVWHDSVLYMWRDPRSCVCVTWSDTIYATWLQIMSVCDMTPYHICDMTSDHACDMAPHHMCDMTHWQAFKGTLNSFSLILMAVFLLQVSTPPSPPHPPASSYFGCLFGSSLPISLPPYMCV